ncbi:choice-of-anchor Q domain-containing protein [Algivirga pacifica]|uniref:Por secretion system C-terminal sorting domain-containing protein n=1 Tax=Algivirga pacifica TaxID=1162670 RepID=A0ABP9CXJ9_9BACT
MKLKLFLANFLLCCSIGLYAQNSWYVAPNGLDTNAGTDSLSALASIQKTIDLSSATDTIWVLAGEYTENIDFKGKDIVLQSKDGVSSTILRPSNVYVPLVKFNTDETNATVIKGFTMIGGGKDTGIALQVSGNASPEVWNCIIQDFGDGAISILNAGTSSLKVFNTVLTDNLQAVKYNGNSGDVTLAHCTFVANDRQGLYDAHLSVYNSIIPSMAQALGANMYHCFMVNEGCDPCYYEDPLVLSSFELHDYSPAIGAAYNYDLGVVTDLYGNPRSYADGKNADVGAIEHELDSAADIPIILYVDDNGSDSGLGTEADPINSIAMALTLAVDDSAKIVVKEGTYTEELSIDKNIHIQGEGEEVILEESLLTLNGGNVQLENLRIQQSIAGATSLESVINAYNSSSTISDTLTLKNVSISNNARRALVLNGWALSMENCQVLENTGHGGLYLSNCSADISNTIIAKNTSSDHGAGVYLGEGATVNFNHVTITENNTSAKGGGIYYSDVFTEVNLENSIVYGNIASGEVSDLDWIKQAQFYANYSLVGGGYIDGVKQEGVWSGTANVTGDPKFRASSKGDYSLLPDSPALEVGSTSSLVLDMNGNTRPMPVGTQPDLGAIETEEAKGTAYLSLTFEQPAECMIDEATVVVRTEVSYSGNQLSYAWSGPDGFTSEDSVLRGHILDGVYRLTLTTSEMSLTDSIDYGAYATVPKLYISTAGDDTNIGSKEAPLASLKKAVALQQECTEFVLADGTYHEDSLVLNKSSIITGANQKEVLIDGSGSYLIFSCEAKSITFNNFTIRNAEVAINVPSTGSNLKSAISLNKLNIIEHDGGFSEQSSDGIISFNDSRLVISNSVIKNNTSEYSLISSGKNTQLIIRNTLIVDNNIINKDGYYSEGYSVIDIKNDPYSDTNNPHEITHTTIAKNTHPYGISENSHVGLQLRNSIVFGHKYDVQTYNVDFQKVLLNTWFSSRTLEEMQQLAIIGNPSFSDPTNGDYTLSENSPAIGAGSMDYVIPYDLAGNPRPNPAGFQPDLGAYEHEDGVAGGSVSVTVTSQGCTVEELYEAEIAVRNVPAPYTIQVTGPNGFTSNSEWLTDLNLGGYQVLVTDSEGIEYTTSFELVDDFIKVEVDVTNVACGESVGALELLSTLPEQASFYWRNANGSKFYERALTGLSAGFYTLVVTDGAKGCTIEKEYEVKANSAIENFAIVIEGDQEVCAEGVPNTLLKLDGTYDTYKWFQKSEIGEWNLVGEQSTYSVNSVGDYQVIVTKDGQCGVDAVSITARPAITLTQQICVVSVDPATGKNMVVWDKQKELGIATYRVYKEVGDNDFQLVGKVPFDGPNYFVDTESNPLVAPERYALSVVDECGVESSRSIAHKTIYLQANQGVNGSVNLSWTTYEGFTVSQVRILRGPSLDRLQVLDTRPASNSQYSDVNPSANERIYVIEAVNTAGCYIETNNNARVSEQLPINGARSNPGVVEGEVITKIDDFEVKQEQIIVYPNPSQGNFMIKHPYLQGEYTMLLKDINGKVIETIKQEDETSEFVSLSVPGLVNGVYFLFIQVSQNTLIKKVVINNN